METKGVDPIPFIDLSGLLERGSERWERLCQEVRKACESFGVFSVKYDGIPGCVKEEMFEAMKDVFDLPTETKKKNYNPKPYFGYVGGYDVLPLYESLGVEDATEMEVAEAFTRLMWPDGKPEFWANNVLSDSSASDSDPPASEGGVQGLQVQSKDGLQWFDVALPKDTFIVFIGETFKVWSNGRLNTARHRVVMGEKERFSCGIFSVPKEGSTVEVPKELVDKDHPLLFKPFNFLEYVAFAFANLSGENSVEAFAGIKI